MAGKGQPKTGGRAKGTTNKLTADVKAMVLEALDKAGGVTYLLKQAQTNPNAFMTLVGKVLPLTLAGDPDHPLVTAIERSIVRSKD
ncbi:hypothetical protein [Pseudoxanthomonas sp. CF125]|uniref:hypothetical protein n=1 Tax=Pseudoxanthomonas sp. CF125 TaxID=1855303 RepID=UPI00088048F9|nr:hypothetical protein [Pseudoxanthomonas sp. CF125]SDQ42361.1 hypothetical protein SAMN05216569_1070 [Pseudoxanthomonas sp. CF125]